MSLAALKAKYDPGNWSGSTKTSGRLPSDQQPDNLSPEDIQKLEKAEAEALDGKPLGERAGRAAVIEQRWRPRGAGAARDNAICVCETSFSIRLRFVLPNVSAWHEAEEPRLPDDGARTDMPLKRTDFRV